MNKVVIQDSVKFVPNGGQLYCLNDNMDMVEVADDVAKRNIRDGRSIYAPTAVLDNCRPVLKRIGFAYAEADGPGTANSLRFKVRTGHVLVALVNNDVQRGIVCTYVSE